MLGLSLATCPVTVSKETYAVSKETYALSKETYFSVKRDLAAASYLSTSPRTMMFLARLETPLSSEVVSVCL